MALRFVDSHCHLDHVVQAHPARIGWMKALGGAAVGWSFAHEVPDVPALERYWRSQVRAVEEAARAGLVCAFLVGVHPRNIPPDLRPEQVEHLLRPWLDHPLCRGVGEIGLETGEPREVEVLEAQLGLADELARRGQVFGVHTPRSDKARVTREVLAVLARHPRARDRTVVDHATPETAGWGLEAGCRLGMTLSPAKCSPDDVRAVLRDHPEAADRLMLNTDSGTRFHEDLWRFVREGGAPDGVLERITRTNAAEFFSLPVPMG